MADRLANFNPAHELNSDDAIAIFVADAFASGDAGYIARALGVAVRAKGVARIASKTGLSRDHLRRSLSERGNLTLRTTLAVLEALGLKLTVAGHGSHYRDEARAR